MANPSIYAAFERMWQHIIAKLGTKADDNHTHDYATTSSNGFMSTADKAKLDNISEGAASVTIREW